MTAKVRQDRTHGVLVTFREGLRPDEAERIIDMLKLINGVIDAQPVGPESSWEMLEAEARVRREWGKKLLEIIYPKAMAAKD